MKSYSKQQKLSVLTMLLYDALHVVKYPYLDKMETLIYYHTRHIGTHGIHHIKQRYPRDVEQVNLADITEHERNYLIIDIATKLLCDINYKDERPKLFLELVIQDFTEGIEYVKDDSKVFDFLDKIYDKTGVN